MEPYLEHDEDNGHHGMGHEVARSPLLPAAVISPEDPCIHLDTYGVHLHVKDGGLDVVEYGAMEEKMGAGIRGIREAEHCHSAPGNEENVTGLAADISYFSINVAEVLKSSYPRMRSPQFQVVKTA